MHASRNGTVMRVEAFVNVSSVTDVNGECCEVKALSLQTNVFPRYAKFSSAEGQDSF